jgi:hypothetical protein
MSSSADIRSRSFGGRLRKKWNNFTGTQSGDTVAALLTVVVMFGAMFGCAFVIVMGMDGIQLILRPH